MNFLLDNIITLAFVALIVAIIYLKSKSTFKQQKQIKDNTVKLQEKQLYYEKNKVFDKVKPYIPNTQSTITEEDRIFFQKAHTIIGQIDTNNINTAIQLENKANDISEMPLDGPENQLTEIK